MPTLRSIGKSCLAYAYSWSGASHFRAQKSGTPAMPFIVGYHRVVEDFHRSKTTTIPSMLISMAMLERHIDWLTRRFSIISLDEIGLHMQSGRPFRRPVAAITFDDGYSDNYHHAYPLLQRKGVPSAIFVVTGLIGTGRPQIFDRLYLLLRELERYRLPVTNTFAEALRSNGFDASPLERWIPPDAGSDARTVGLMTSILNSF